MLVAVSMKKQVTCIIVDKMRESVNIIINLFPIITYESIRVQFVICR